MNLDTEIRDTHLSIRTQNVLSNANIVNVRQFLEFGKLKFLSLRNVGQKTIEEIEELHDQLSAQLSEEIEKEKTGWLWWKCQHDSYNYGILLKDGTVLYACEVKKKGFGWVDIILGDSNNFPDLVMFGKKRSEFKWCKSLISVRIEHIAAICELES